MSIVSYNGVTLPYAQTTEFNQVAVADDSNTDWHLIRVDVTVQALLNSAYLTTYCPDLVNGANDDGTANYLSTNPADGMHLIRQKLLTRRKTLSITVNGVSVLPEPQEGNQGTCDAENGPVPVFCNIMGLSSTTFWIVYRIRAAYWENSSGQKTDSSPFLANKRGNIVLYNRWTESVEIDYNDFSTVTREGKFKIRSDNYLGYTADQARTMMVPLSIQKGFLRTSRHFSVSADGLTISYRITDKEQYKMPPQPAFKATGTYTESYAKMGVKKFGKVHLRLEGSKVTSQAQLLQVAMAVAASKLHVSGAFNDGNGFTMMQGAEITLGLYENWVEVTATCQLAMSTKDKKGNPKDRLEGLAGINWNGIDKVPRSDPLKGEKGGELLPPEYQSRGSARIFLQAAKYFDPNISNNTLAQNKNSSYNMFGNMAQGKSPGQAGKNKET